jgi:hypothetical protein
MYVSLVCMMLLVELGVESKVCHGTARPPLLRRKCRLLGRLLAY